MRYNMTAIQSAALISISPKSKNKNLFFVFSLFLVLLLGSCSDDSVSTNTSSPGVGQGGSQDFGLFRAIVDKGEIPSPGAMDDVGFFNEHKLLLPEAECNDDICLHVLSGIGGNLLTGSVGTMVMVGMNTPIDVNELERKPLNLAITVDVSGSMRGDNLEYVVRGLKKMLDYLEPEDRISLIAYDTRAEILVEYVSSDSAQLHAAIDELRAAGQTNIYDGLRLAFDTVDRNRDSSRQNRVILLSDGMATAGIVNDDRIIHMSESYAKLGYGITTIGVGTEFNVDLMRSISETGSGNFYFVEDPAAVEEVFTEEIQTFLVPLATDVKMNFEVGDGYRIGGIYGTKRSKFSRERGEITIPSLFIAHRESTSEPNSGRRGGGGAILIQLIPSITPPDGYDPLAIGIFSMEYTVPDTGDVVRQSKQIISPVHPDEVSGASGFNSETISKAFVMLNLFVGMQMATERAETGDYNSALAILNQLEHPSEWWVTTYQDSDIQDDLGILRKFMDNLKAAGAAMPVNYLMPEPKYYYCY